MALFKIQIHLRRLEKRDSTVLLNLRIQSRAGRCSGEMGSSRECSYMPSRLLGKNASDHGVLHGPFIRDDVLVTNALRQVEAEFAGKSG